MSGSAVHFPLSGAIDGVPTHYPAVTDAIRFAWDEAIASGAYTPSGAELAAIEGGLQPENADLPPGPGGIYPAVLVAYVDWTDPQGPRCIIMNGQMPLTGMG
jgi:hypothetical protein